MTGKKLTSSDRIIVSTDGNKTGFGIEMIQERDGVIILMMTVVGAGSCVDQGDKINIFIYRQYSA